MEVFADNPKLIGGIITTIVLLVIATALVVWSAGTVEPI